MRLFLRKCLKVIDFLLIPFVIPSAILMKYVRKVGFRHLKLCRKVLLKIGVLPVIDHYYEPQIDMRVMKKPDQKRNLPGIDWNIDGQVELLKNFRYSSEFDAYIRGGNDELLFSFDNHAFKSGDAEFWYQLIRYKKPHRIYEVGSGHSTLLAVDAIKKNREEDSGYSCQHICIEPYEMAWLEKTGVEVIRNRVEDVGVDLFMKLEEGDILFIDSSHVIRPEGDVLFEYLELLPQLKKGVIVHVHDIFSPRNYLEEWLVSEVKLWNEQYLLEAFLTENKNWKVIGAVNFLKNDKFDEIKKACPFLTEDREPGSFYIEKVN